MGLRAKFNLVLVVTFAVGMVLSGIFTYGVVARHALEEVVQNARMARASAKAIRAYTSSQIQPLVVPAMQDTFLPQSVPSYAAHENFRILRETFPDLDYKEAALNPTNPSDRAADWEADIIRTFRNDPSLKEITTRRETPTGRVLTIAEPIKVSSESCLVCHSTPDQAPVQLISAYGSANGFGWAMNEIVGAQLISIPLNVPFEKARREFLVSMGLALGIFAVLFVVLNLLLNRIVLRPIRRISTLADEVSLGKLDAPEHVVQGKDEIATLAQAFNRMRRSLVNALRLIES